MARLKTRWNIDRATRAQSETASVISTNIWRIITESLLDMENAGFGTESSMQRLDILSEFAAYAIHLLDRYIYHSPLVQERQKIVSQTAQHLRDIIHDNRCDIHSATDEEVSFITLFNQRSDEYSECQYDGGPDFQMRRLLGEHVSKIICDTNRRWADVYVLDVAAHTIHTSLRKFEDRFLLAHTKSSH